MAEIDESIDRLGNKIDGLAVQVSTLGNKVDDLAVQVGSLTESITRLERNVEKQASTADKNAEHIAQLIGVVDKLVSRN
ncbi:hypothetical protein JOY44_29600 (plasmid) [Phormidium sp. CLA17]|uniref:hypothetical protein n=1 Tax=Leptolyngbya sp. Cla-17 TaxID=2803751 RepID=UPI001491EB28|nr:hypothetical protein [Leptolyngbya sp. Cla-17]MBM0745578.1 hypothetical protein [Leptolyngbya sp. Cla-17]